MDIAEQVKNIAREARQASFVMARLGTDVKNRMLMAMADALENQTAALIAENARDLDTGRQKGLSAAMLDRLMLDRMRILPTISSLGRFHILVTSPTGSGNGPMS